MKLINNKLFLFAFVLGLVTAPIFSQANDHYAHLKPNQLSGQFCIVSQQAKERLAKLKIKVDVETFVSSSDKCKNSYLGQFLDSVDKLKKVSFQNIPSQITNEITLSLRKPWQYILDQNITAIAFDKSSRAIAGYNIDNGKLLISRQFFEVSSAVQAATLIHEAAHSNPTRPWHDVCYHGQLAATVGGCDSAIETIPALAGAYSIEYWFLQLVAQTGSSFYEGSEIFAAKKIATELISHRFNHAFHHAQFNDLLVGLDEDKQVLIFDPLFKEFTNLEGQSGPIKKISKNESNHGLYLFDENDNLLSWNPDFRKVAVFSHYNIESFQGRIANIQRPIHPHLGVNRNLITTTDGKQYLEGLDQHQQRKYLPHKSSFSDRPLFVLRGQRHLFINDDGQIEILDPQHQPLQVMSSNSSLLTDAIFPNHYGSAFYSINSEGSVYFSNIVKDRETHTDLGSQNLLFEKDEFQAPKGSKAVKISEGLGYRALLSNKGQVTIKPHSKNRKVGAQSASPTKELSLSSTHFITNLVWTKTTRLEHQPVSDIQAQNIATFQKNCSLDSQVDIDPWLHRPIGLNAQGEVIVLQNSQCRVLLRGVVYFQLVDAGIGINTFGYNQTAVQIKYKDGREQTLLPLHQSLH